TAFQNWLGNLVRFQILSWKFYNLLPPLMKEANPTAAPPMLHPFGANLSAWLMLLQTRYPETFLRMNATVRDVFPQLSGIFTTPTEQSKVFLSSNEKGLSKSIAISQMSDGEVVFLALLSL